MKSKHDVFLSYTQDDNKLIKKIVKSLKIRGLKCFFDKDNINWGDKFPEKIYNSIAASQYFLLLISKSYIKSEWCIAELNTALSILNDKNKKIHVLPLLHPTYPESDYNQVNLLKGIQYRIYDSPDEIADAILHLGQIPTLETQLEWSDINKREISFEKFINIDSWLSKERKTEISKLVIDNLPKLKEHRQNHLIRLKKRWEIFPVYIDRNLPAWLRISSTKSEAGYRLIIGFRNCTCNYRNTEPLNLGCFNCGYYAGAGPMKRASSAQLIEQLRSAFHYGFKTKRHFDVIEFLCDGSFFNDYEFSDRGKDKIFEYIAKMPYIKRVLVESTPEHIYSQTSEIPERLRKLRKDQILEIGIGLETSDDFIRKVCINKGFMKIHFERAIETVARFNKEFDNRCCIVAYLLIKPAFLKPFEIIKDTLKTIKYLNNLSIKYNVEIIPKLEPAAISDGTILSLLYQNPASDPNQYKPLNYWTILEIITKVYLEKECEQMYKNLRIGAREDMDDVIKVPGVYKEDGRFDQFDFILYDSIQEFNQHHDIFLLYSMISETYLQTTSKYFLSTKSTLRKWINTALIPFNEQSSIINFYNNNKEKISTAIEQSNRNEISFLKKVYETLDIIEGHNYHLSPKVMKKIENIVLKEAITFQDMIKKDVSDLKRSNSSVTDLTIPLKKSTLSDLRKVLFECFSNQNLTLFEIEVIDVSVDYKGFIKIFFEAIDFISGRFFPLWTMMPVSEKMKRYLTIF